MPASNSSTAKVGEPVPDFDDFYRAVNGRDPFPWQSRLARQVASDEAWPAGGIGIQTGLGKTACLDIAIWWLASQADRPPAERTAPTRIWWVVNRRLLVDSTAEHAETIHKALAGPASTGNSESDAGVLDSISLRLRSLSADPNGEALEVIRLRGGIASKTPTDPSSPAVILCTLPMYGSRLLFRGYGSRLRSVDAAMAGTDSLVLLDEAHLAPHLQRLLPSLADCAPHDSPVLNEARIVPQLVALTATGDADCRERFEIDEEDERNPVVRKRLEAVKPLEIRIEDRGDAARHLADAAEEILRNAPGPATCLVFANTPKTARAAFGRIRKVFAAPTAEVLLLTGLGREREAERTRSRLLDPDMGLASGSGRSGPRDRHLIVVATQTLEAGADLDAQFLVTEACGVRALTQRLGRLNRLGLCSHARAVYLHLPPPKGKGADAPRWPVYGEEPATVLETLEHACRDDPGHTVNLAPGRIARVLGQPADHSGRAPMILPALLWEWAKTTVPAEGEAPVEPYFSGISGPDYSVSLLWRAHVPGKDQRLWPRASEREAVDVPIAEARTALKDKELHRIGPDGVTVEVIVPSELRPGDQVVLSADCGLLDEFGWNPEASGLVPDMSLKERGLPLDGDAIERLCGTDLGSSLDELIRFAVGTDEDGDELDPDDRSAAVAEILSRVRAVPTPPGWEVDEWSEYTSSLREHVVVAPKEVPRLRVVSPRADPPAGELDEMCLAESATDLDRHCLAVAARSRAVADRVGLLDGLCEVLEKAGRFHDIGKADRRFQRWLDPDGSRGLLVAKSNAPRHLWEAMRASAGWPRGGRHEDLSCRLAHELLPARSECTDQDSGDLHRELVLHLVISHHGNGRPLVVPIKDGTRDRVSFTLEGKTVSALSDLEIVDWEQPRRFRRLNDYFGPWGLALLEATLIRSDHAVSRGAEVAT